MMPSSTTNSSINNDRKRRGVSLTNSKKLRRSELINNSKTERLSRSSSISDTLYMTQEYSLTNDISRYSQINDMKIDNDLNEIKSIENDEELNKTKINSNKISSVVVSPIITTTNDLTKNSLHSDNTKLLKLVVPQSTSIKMLLNGDGLSSALRIPTKIQLTKTLSIQNDNNQESSTKLDNTEKEQTTNMDYPLTPPPPIVDSSQKINQNLKNIKSIDCEHQIVSKRHSYSLADWSVPPTSELSPTSLTSSSPDDSFVEFDLKINQIPSSSSSIKRRYRSLSFSCPILPYCIEENKPITPPYKSKSLSRISNLSNKKLRSMSPVIKYSSIERLKRRRKDHQIYGKKLKFKTENPFIIKDILNEIIEQIEFNNNNDDKDKILLDTSVSQLKNIEESRSTLTKSIPVNISEINDDTTKDEECVNDMNHHQEIDNQQKTILRQSKKSIYDENLPLLSTDIELKRQTSTPLSFHSIPSSGSIEDQSINSPHSVSKTHIFTDIVNELIKGAKGLDKLSCSLITFTNSIHNFIRLTIEKQTEQVENLKHELEKKCLSQLNRANIFCTKKIEYFLNKHSILLINEYINEITLIIKYFYFFILSLNYRKQENEFELILNNLINGKYTFINESFYSSILTTIINDFILTSSLANDYLSSQPILINQIEYSLPFIRNIEYENELLYKNDISLNGSPFLDSNDLENYLNSCEHFSTNIPYYPIQHSVHPSMYYPNYSSSGQYYYPSSSTDMTPYYHPHPHHHPSPYSNCQQSYGYNNHPYPLISYHEQYNYYYNQQMCYNSTNDIPLSNNNNNNSYRRLQNLENSTSTVFESSNVTSPSKSTITTNSIYPS